MLCRFPVASCLLLVLGACRQVADLGGAADDLADCTEGCLDASALKDGGPPRPDAFVSSVDAAAFHAFNEQLNGLWYGISRRTETDAPRFEISLDIDPGSGEGSFRVRCLDDFGCDPFGPGSANPAGGRIEVLDLESRPGKPLAQGRLRWATGVREMPFWAMEISVSNGAAVLTFDGGLPGVPPYSGTVYDVVLAAGAWPDAAVGGEMNSKQTQPRAGDPRRNGALP